MKQRTKMPRTERAKQFAPFDALKGLQTALRIKEFEHERKSKADLSEEQTEKIGRALFELEKGDFVKVEFFRDGKMHTIEGNPALDIEKMALCFSQTQIPCNDILDMQILQKSEQKNAEIDVSLEIFDDFDEN